VNQKPPTVVADADQLEANGSEVESDSGTASDELPRIDFATFVLSLSHSALVHLGDAPNPVDGSADQNLPMARQTIDLLGLLEEKTRGNLSGEEERILQQVLYDLRSRYVEVSRHK
jgi:hypothetical protein